MTKVILDKYILVNIPFNAYNVEYVYSHLFYIISPLQDIENEVRVGKGLTYLGLLSDLPNQIRAEVEALMIQESVMVDTFFKWVVFRDGDQNNIQIKS